MKVYAFNALSDKIRKESSSGGAFSLLASYVLTYGGVVFGTALTDGCKEAVITTAYDSSDLVKLRGSKYLQSKVGNSYILAEKELKKGRPVLFTGTPCQINALRLYLGKDYDKLYCVDIICHGVPSPALWRKYTEDFEVRHKGRIVDVNFRYKGEARSEGKAPNQKVVYSAKDIDPYMQMFLKNYSLRPSCYHCAAKTYRTADITLGDFWGAEDVQMGLDDGKGISVVIFRTKKGRCLFDQVKDNGRLLSIDYETAVKHNYPEYRSVTKPIQRATFFADMNQMSFSRLKRKYLGLQLKSNLRELLKNGKKDVVNSNSKFGLLITFERR